ncbi:MAG: YfhO family protein, partial [Planctomycetes bacterium]|nr:YfhO family protein [Planctomycetota bacterium]
MDASESKRDRLWLVAVLFYLCIAVFYFREALFTDRVQVCGDLALSTYPWALESPKDFKPRNVALSDQCSVFYPWFYYNAQKLKAGELPLWTPHVLGGVPYMGNLSCAIFYPLNLLVAVIPLTAFFLVQSLFKVVAAGGFMFLFLRILGLRFIYALFGGMIYALCGFTILWVISHLTSVSILMPALFWATEIYLKRRNGLSLCLITLLLALQFLGAQPETSFCICAAWGVYSFFRIRQASGLFTRTGILQLVYISSAGLLSMGLVLFQLWPFLEYMVRSYGLVIRKQGAEAAARYGGTDTLFSLWGIGLGIGVFLSAWAAAWLLRKGRKPFAAFTAGLLAGTLLVIGLKAGLTVGFKSYFLIQLFPELYGNVLDGVKTAGGAAYPEFNGGYAGVLGFMLAMVGWFACGKNPPVRIIGALFLFSFGAVYGIPFIYQFVRAVPGFELTQPGRIISITAFSLSVLSAFGLDHVMRRVPKAGQRGPVAWRALGIVIIVGL